MYDIDMGESKAEVGRIIVNRNYGGRGYATFALKGVCNIAYSQGIRLLYASIYQHNIASKRSFRKAGFELEDIEDGKCYAEISL